MLRLALSYDWTLGLSPPSGYLAIQIRGPFLCRTYQTNRPLCPIHSYRYLFKYNPRKLLVEMQVGGIRPIKPTYRLWVNCLFGIGPNEPHLS